jgi:hypothetical protein
MKLEFSGQIFEKYLNIKFHNIRPVGAELFRTDRHDEANSRCSQSCERAQKLLNHARKMKDFPKTVTYLTPKKGMNR